MCSWLIRQQYLLVSPVHGLAKVGNTKRAGAAVGRTLTHAQWRFVLQTVSRPDPTPADQRDHFSLLLVDATGLRRAELVAAATGAPSCEAHDGALDDAWTLQVRGQRPARAAGADARAADAGDCRLAAGAVRAVYAADRASGYSIGHLKTGRPRTPDALARVYKRIFTRAAQQLECAYPGGAADLRRASSHGLRHTYANHALDAGSYLRDVQTNLGHAGLSTTTLHTKGNDARRYQAVNALFEDALSAGGA